MTSTDHFDVAKITIAATRSFQADPVVLESLFILTRTEERRSLTNKIFLVTCNETKQTRLVTNK